MHEDYEDIRNRISEEPKWFDENAVPRYCAFSPRCLANIYADEAALVQISCQGCGHPFMVAFSRSDMDDVRARMMGVVEPATLSAQIEAREIHYGDPPNVDCCPAGPTMNSEPERVIEYWKRDNFDWHRDHELEINLDTPGNVP